ncbi:uncharacterized protein LOC133835719 isoform X3 [Drosophila sulfurigaster albostrigata]|uniref:uncharacterized protein LOC133835719 isoform X3 n=1 Tax=Drosophila sulfurigaster albostrigata TaxID=89887 RepID=UPI002D21EACB|nr:uncharacterized protein LOC133835719 isoform X3 [Drosophila sulfurigaster albostrigata]
MRIFGKMTRFLQISRCLRYHAPICRPHRLLHGSCKQWKKICSNCASWQPPLLMEIRPHLPMRIHVQLFTTRTTNVFTFNNASDMLRKRICFTGTQNEEAASQIVPVGVIVPDKAESNMKIVIVPLDLVNQDSESLKNTLTVINELRKHANEIDLFTNTIIEDYRKDQLNNQTSDNNNNSNIVEEKAPVMEELEQIAKADDIHLWDTYTTKEVDVVASSAPEISAPELELQAAVASLATDLAASTQADVAPMTPSPFTPSLPNAPPTLPINPNTVPITTPQTQPGAMPLADPIETQISAQPQNEDVPPVAEIEQITIDVPQQLGEHLADMAIASMQLSFEMNMTNVRDAILYGDELIMKDGPKLDSEPMVFLETNVKVDPANEPQFTVPLHFNALIKGTVDIDADRLNPEQLTQENLPNYNDAVTSIAANICSTALQQGFASELTSKPTAQANHDSHKSHAQARMALKRHQAQKHMKMDHKRPKVEYNSPKAALPNTLPQESLAAAVPMPLSPSLKDGCKHPIIKKKKKCPKPCKLPDPCKEDKCNRPQKHQKSKSEDKVEITASAGKKGGKDPCAKGSGSKGKDAKSGKDGKGGKDGKDKKDPCAKFKKGKDGKDAKSKKGGKDGKDKKDPCAKFKKGKGGKDAKSKKGGKDGKDKKDPCAKFKKGKGGKDAKSKKGGKDGKDKKDPCAKFKKGKGGKDAKSKKDPCKKKFSTCTSPLSQLNQSKSLWHPKRRLSTSRRAQSLKPAHFTVYSTLVRRHYAGLQMSAWLPRTQFNRTYGKKDEGQKSKCAALQSKQPKRKHKKARTGLRTDCYGQHSDECPKKFVAKCSTVKFPKKKCEKPKSKPPMAKMQKPKKKLPNVCKHANPRQERNKLLKSGLCSLNQMRMQSYSLLSIKRFVSQAATENCMPQEEEASSGSVEVVKIPVSYHIRKEHKERPNLKKYDVLIRTASIALTGSDIHVYENANRDIEGITLGHDATGFVEEIGSCVQNLHVGDRVVMEAALSCGICDYCKNGQYNICTDLVYNGFMASHQSHPADLCHRLPNSISMEEGTLTQTLAMGCQACFKANITPTSNVLIIGSTPTGVSTAMCAAAIGAKRVIVAGTMASALQTINRVFGFATIHFEPNALFGEVLETIYKNFDGWPNCAINCAVAPMTMNLAVMALQPCGVCVLSECECECASFNALDVLMKNIRIIPSFRSANMYPTALTLMKSGRAPMHKFIAKTFTWSELDEAFKSALHESNIGPRKIIVNSTEGINIGDLLKKKLNSNVADNKVACDK